MSESPETLELPDRAVDRADAHRVYADAMEGLFGTKPEPARIGRFALIEKLGEGGMGVVYSAFDPQLDRKVAIKLLHDREEPSEGERAGGDLLHEARTLAKLRHPNVATVYEAGTSEGALFLAMEFVDGVSLQHWMTREQPLETRLDVFEQAVQGLRAAHAEGIVHGDIKPANLMIDNAGRLVVLDFGLAQVRDVATIGGRDVSLDDEEMTASRWVGTPAYMAPEQWLGQRATMLSDQWSLCATFYEAFFGHRFRKRGRADAGSVQPTTGVPPWLGALIDRGTHQEPDERWPSLDALVTALQRGRGRASRRLRMGGAVASVAAVALASAWLGGTSRQGDPCATINDRVHAAWNDDVRERADAALEGRTSEGSINEALTALDGFVDALVEARSKACLSTQGDAPYIGAKAELTCLDRALDDLEATTGLLTTPDDRAAKHVSRLVPRVDRLVECSAVFQPALAAADAARRDVDAQLAHAAALVDAGQADEGRALAQEALAKARELDDDGLAARAGLRLGRAMIFRDEITDAIEILHTASVDAEKADDPIARIAALHGLAQALIKAAQYDEAERIIDVVSAAQARFTPRLIHWDFDLASSQAELAIARKDYEAAFLHYTEARAVASNAAMSPAVLASNQTAIAGALIRLRRFDDALEHVKEAREWVVRLHGEGHEGLAVVESLSGLIYNAQGDRVAAEAAFRRSLEIRERVVGPEHASLSGILTNLGGVLVESDPKAAIEVMRRSVRIASASRGPKSGRVAKAHYSLGRALLKADRLEDALESFRASFLIHDEKASRADPERLLAMARMGQTKAWQDRCADAMTLFDEIVDLADPEQRYQADPYLYALTGQARCGLAGGRITAATEAIDEAWKVVEQAELKGEEVAATAIVHANLLLARSAPISEVETAVARAKAELGESVAHILLVRELDAVRARLRE